MGSFGSTFSWAKSEKSLQVVRPPATIAKVGEHKSNNYGLWYLQLYSYWGESKPTNITGGPHIVGNTFNMSSKLKIP